MQPLPVIIAWERLVGLCECGESKERTKDQSAHGFLSGSICGSSGFLDLAVFDDDGVEEGHGFAKFGADFFDLEFGFGFADACKLVAARLVFGDEFFGEAAVLNVVEE